MISQFIQDNPLLFGVFAAVLVWRIIVSFSHAEILREILISLALMLVLAFVGVQYHTGSMAEQMFTGVLLMLVVPVVLIWAACSCWQRTGWFAKAVGAVFAIGGLLIFLHGAAMIFL